MARPTPVCSRAVVNVAELRGDQASGLRRLFGQEATRTAAFVAGGSGVGKSSLVASIALAIARQGKEVLVIDENTKKNVAASFGALARHDLYQVIQREKSLADVMLTVAPGVRVLPAAQAVRDLAKLTPAQQQALLSSFTGMERAADVILVDASLDHPLGFSPLGLAAQETVVVISGTGDSITEAYALIKKVSLSYARKHYRLLVNRIRSADEARAIHTNMAHLCVSRGFARLDYAGFVPVDEQLRQASRLGQPVVGLFPEAPAAKACAAIAADLLGWPLPDSGPGGVEQFVQQLLHFAQQIDPIAIYA